MFRCLSPQTVIKFLPFFTNFVTGNMIMTKEDSDKMHSNFDFIVQLLSIDEYDVWRDYFYEFLSSAVSTYSMSLKIIIIVSIQKQWH